METIKAHIYIAGDSSVGIQDLNASADTGVFDLENEDEREFVREELQKAYGNIHDASPAVWFSDECPDCLLILPTHKNCCPNKLSSDNAQFASQPVIE